MTSSAPHAEYADDGDVGFAPPLTRMAIAVLSLVGIFVALYLSMYKWGVLGGGIQCSIGGCDTVQNSPWSYFLGQPVAVWGLFAYATLLAVAVVGLQPRFVNARWVALALFGISAVGVLFSGYLTYLEAAVIHAWCMYCVISAILITLIFLLSIPGLRGAR
ncbi:MAG TPA: vitamin K epoxide reductase family protein [Longimicrobium sp.]|nr:vitamin K epoxide reductase family protein [Longimicrobium sp.]